MNRITKKLFGRHVNMLTWGSLVRLRLARMLGWPRVVRVRLRRGGVPFYARPRGTDLLAANEVFCKDSYAVVVKTIPNCQTMIDLGAHIGLASLFFMDHYPEAKVFAVEAYPPTFSVLQRNFAAAGAQERCRAMNLAAWNTSGEVNIAPPPQRPRAYLSMRASASNTDARRSFKVPSATLSDIITRSGFQQVDLLKVDIEGAETELFQTIDTWVDRVGAMAVEFHGDSRDQSRFDSLMATHGFDVVQDNSHTVLAIKHRWFPTVAWRLQSPCPDTFTSI